MNKDLTSFSHFRSAIAAQAGKLLFWIPCNIGLGMEIVSYKQLILDPITPYCLLTVSVSCFSLN